MGKPSSILNPILGKSLSGWMNSSLPSTPTPHRHRQKNSIRTRSPISMRSSDRLLTPKPRVRTMSDGPYLFDVGVIALAHSQAPVADAALSYVRQAVAGEINAVVPTTAVIGAHNVLTTHY